MCGWMDGWMCIIFKYVKAAESCHLEIEMRNEERKNVQIKMYTNKVQHTNNKQIKTLNALNYYVMLKLSNSNKEKKIFYE